jgi:hypothetical protein
MFIAFRCVAAPSKDAPRGHMHDDNLAVEYRLGAAEQRDPGSFVYTPSVATRNCYRVAAAHDVPRVVGEPLTRVGSELFYLEQFAFAKCVVWRSDGVAGEIKTVSGRLLRLIKIERGAVCIYDCVDPPVTLAPLSEPPALSRGYGRL